MRDAAAKFEEAIFPHVTSSDTMLPLYSTVTGGMISNPAHLNAAHWRNNLHSPVLFLNAVQNLLDQKEDRSTIFLEIGPHSTLSGPLRQILTDRSVKNSHYVPTLLKNAEQMHSLLKAVGEIYCQGSPVDFSKIYGNGKVVTDLPVYPWDRQSIDWKESRLSYNWRFRKHPSHELLGSRMLEASDLEPAWRNLLSLRSVPWLIDHKVLGETVFPCAGFIAVVNEAIRQLFNTQECTIRNLHIKVPLVLPTYEGTTVELVTTMRPVRINDRLDSKWYDFSISSYDGSEWTKHAVGKAVGGAEDLTTPTSTPQQFERSVSSPFWYKMLASIGLQYGPYFQGLEDITADPVSFTASAMIRGHSSESENSRAIHPTAIDQCLQLLSVAACNGKSVHLTKLYIPMYIDEISLGHSTDVMRVKASGDSSAGIQGQGSVRMMSGKDTVLTMRGVTLFQLEQRKASQTSEIPLLSHAEWRPDLDLLPSHLQLPLSQKSGDAIELVSRIAVVSLIIVHRKTLNLQPSSDQLESYKVWLESQVRTIRERGVPSIAEAEVWAQMNSERLQLHLLTLNKQLKVKKLDFISELAQLTIQERTAAFEQSSSSSISLKRRDALRQLDDWVSSLSDLSKWLSLLSHSNPRLRILEIGGERGSFSSFVLKNLTSDGATLHSKYTWTETSHIDDIVKERLQNYKSVDFKYFNVNQDPSQQDFEENSYDLIIFSKVSLYFLVTVAV
jgi:acyl transferase domain-containing protein